jgi:hypothetical protein
MQKMDLRHPVILTDEKMRNAENVTGGKSIVKHGAGKFTFT